MVQPRTRLEAERERPPKSTQAAKHLAGRSEGQTRPAGKSSEPSDYKDAESEAEGQN